MPGGGACLVFGLDAGILTVCTTQLRCMPPMTKEAVFMCEPNLATMHSTSRQMCADDYTQYRIHQYTVYSILFMLFQYSVEIGTASPPRGSVW